MSNSAFLVIILLCIIVALIATAKNRLKYKKSILFNITTVTLFPILVAAILGVLVGARGMIHFVWAAPMILIVATIGYEIIARRMQNPLNEIFTSVDALSTGDVEIKFNEKYQKGDNELTLALRRIFQYTQSLKKIASFANQIGKGNLNVEYRLMGERDNLGRAMLDMRANIQKAEEEKEERQLEDERRNWVTHGVAKFAEILRKDNDNMEALSYNVISNMVRYLGANQGGIFVLNEDNEEKVLEMKACYAFDRKKYFTKTVRPGEGLIGACFLEGAPVYMTNIPQNYITITSGLGGAKPNALVICPLKVNDNTYGVIELASFSAFEPYQREFLQKVSESIASTISLTRMNMHTNKLLRQNMEEMQAIQDEVLRKSKEAEQAYDELTKATIRLNLLQKSINIALWDMEVNQKDPIGGNNEFWCTPEFRKLLGFNDEFDFPNVLSSWSNRLHPEDKEKTLYAFYEHLTDKTGKTPYHVKYRLQRKTGEYVWIKAAGETLRDAKGMPLRVVGSVREIFAD